MSDEIESKKADNVLRDKIALRAFFKYCERGCVAGFDVEDWLQAEREVLAERAPGAGEATAPAPDAAHGTNEVDPVGPNPPKRRQQTGEQMARRPGRGARTTR